MTTTPEDNFESTVRRRLTELYPLDETGVATPPEVTETIRATTRPGPWIAPAAAAAAVALIVGVGVGVMAMRPNQPGGPDTAGQPSTSPPAAPAWAQGCFKQWADPIAQDADYVGLTKDEALKLAAQRREQLVLVGAGGNCSTVSDDVARPRPVAVAFNARTASDGLPPAATIVLANSNPSAIYYGWGLAD